MDPDSEATRRVFEELLSLERQFVESELDSFRRKEFALRPLYEKRQNLTDRIPDFWVQVLANPPEELQEVFSDSDLLILASLKSLRVERYQIESPTQGDPHSLRFTFEFGQNDHFQDTKLVKDFQHISDHQGNEGLISVPVPIHWKTKKMDVTGGLLDAAFELYQAEETLRLENADVQIDQVERESLWQYEKLQNKLSEMPDEQPSFFNWFGYRGPISMSSEAANLSKDSNGGTVVDHSDEEGADDDQDLDVEIFTGGDEVARALAESLWPHVMDCFMAAQIDGEDDMVALDGDSSDDEAPDLVPGDEPGEDSRPAKRKRTD